MNTIGPLAPFIKQYLELQRSLGLSLRNAEYTLNAFEHHTQQSFPNAKTITRAMVTGYLQTLPHLETTSLHGQISLLRQFCRFLFLLDPETYIPAGDLVPPSRKSRQSHVYTKDEAKRLIVAALTLSPPKSLRPHTYATLLSLLWVSGIRIGEALRLNLEDIDVERCLLHIRQSKFYKSRLVPLASSSILALEEYLVRRATYGHDERPEAPFFVNGMGRRCNYKTVFVTFHLLLQQLDIKTIQGRNPRIHDFRHTFATNYLDRVYNSGKNPGSVLPLLATYLGHANIAHTQIYLHPSFSLLEKSGQQFNTYARGGAYEGS